MKMKHLITLVLVWFMTTSQAFCQNAIGVNWRNPKQYAAKQINFKTDMLSFTCSDCKFIELKTALGIVGVYIIGNGIVYIPSKSIKDKFGGCMIRFNPDEYEKLVQMDGKVDVSDDSFKDTATKKAQKVFKHCYHSGMDALLPPKSAYALDLITENNGDYFVSIDKGVAIMHTIADGEGVNWANPPQFAASQIKIKTDLLTMECSKCKYIEIRTEQGVTGLYIIGTGTIDIPSKSISDKFENCMIRFNPSDYENLVQVNDKSSIKDKKFKKEAVQQLQKVFKHCYHSGMDALIPPTGAYTLDMVTEKYGDLLAGYGDGKTNVYSFSYKKEY